MLAFMLLHAYMCRNMSDTALTKSLMKTTSILLLAGPVDPAAGPPGLGSREAVCLPAGYGQPPGGRVPRSAHPRAPPHLRAGPQLGHRDYEEHR